MLYYKDDQGILQHKSVVMLSDELRHDTVAVSAFQKIVVDDLKRILPSLTKINFWSDGCAAQYKNKVCIPFFLWSTYWCLSSRFIHSILCKTFSILFESFSIPCKHFAIPVKTLSSLAKHFSSSLTKPQQLVGCNFYNFLKTFVFECEVDMPWLPFSSINACWFHDTVNIWFQKNFLNLCEFKTDHGVDANWNFWATSHGKGPWDGLGRVLVFLFLISFLSVRGSDQKVHQPCNIPRERHQKASWCVLIRQTGI